MVSNRSFPLALSLGIALALLASPPARCEELALLVERTAPTTGSTRVVVTSDVEGALVQVRAWRLEQPGPLLDDPASRASATHLAWLAGADEDGAGEAARWRERVRPRPLGSVEVRIAQPRVRQGVDLLLSEPGLYLLAAGREGGPSAYATALTSDLALVTKRHPGGALLWTVDRRTGRPWPGVRVTVQGREVAARSDAQGLLALSGPLPPTVALRAEADGHLAFGEETWFPTDVEQRRVWLGPHQPAYRPGERIEVQGIVRLWQDGRAHLDEGVRAAEVFLVDPRDGRHDVGTVPVNAGLGTFAAGYALPEDAPTGTWRCVARIDGHEHEVAVRVEAYRRPAFEVAVEPAAERLLAGQGTTFAVRAAFYDGGTVAGARVTWELFQTRVDRELFPTDEIVRLFFGAEQAAFEPALLAAGEARLDDRGLLEVPATAPPEALDGWLSLRAVVTGPDGLAAAGSGGLAIHAAPVRVALRTDRHLYGVEDVAAVTVRVERADGRAAAGRAGLLRLDEEPQVLPGRRQALAHHLLPFTTDEHGDARLEVPLPGEGRFRLEAEVARLADEPPGAAVTAGLHVWAAGDRPTIGLPPGELSVVVDRDRHAVGETARLLVVSPAGCAVWAALEGATLLESRVLAPEAGATVWTIPLGDVHAPNVFATFAVVQHGDLRVVSRMLRVPPVQRLLTVGVEPDAATIEPGTTSGATVRVTDAGGRAVAGAAVSLAVVDDALHALFPDPAASLAAFFHPTRRNAVATGGPLHHEAVGAARLAVPESKGRADGGAVPGGLRGPSGFAPTPPSTPAPAPAPGAPPQASGDAPGDEVPEALEELEEVEDDAGVAAGKGGGRRGAPPRARQDFRAGVHWSPALRTDAEGRARVEGIRYADSLTRWRLTARTLDAQTRVGEARATVVARKDVSVRLTTPRFLRANDRADARVVLRNLTDEAASGTWSASAQADDVSWELARGDLVLPAGATTVRSLSLRLASVSRLGVRAAVETDRGGDAEAREVPVLPQGIERVVGHVVASTDGRVRTRIAVPREAVHGTARARVSIEPGHVAAVAAALPYLVGYPHGCTEQTLNRFVPVLAAAEAAAALGVPASGVLAETDAMLGAGVRRLAALQHADGGFGWWADDASDAGMTALVVRGLGRALPHLGEGDPAGPLRARAVAWLAQALPGLEAAASPAALASALLALAEAGSLPEGTLERVLAPAADGVRGPLVGALLLRAALVAGRREALGSLRRALLRDARRTAAGVSWGPAPAAPGGEGPERWEEDPVETTAEVLHALLLAEADRDLLAEGARWLLAARRGGDRWGSTRDTAAAVAFLAAYASRTGDLGLGGPIEARLDGEPLGQVELTRENLFASGGLLELPPGLLVPGRTLELELVATSGTFTAACSVSAFETGPAIRAGEQGLRVQRRYFVLEPRPGGDRAVWERRPLEETVASGALVECEIQVTSRQPRAYVMVTDPHVAGFEPWRTVGLRVADRAAATEAHVERYDDRTCFFLASMPAGTATLRHVLRATHAGAFTALPAQAELMYFPDVRGNGDGEAIEVTAPADAASGTGGGR